MSAPLSQGGNLGGLVKKVVRKKRYTGVGQPPLRRPADIPGSDAAGPYLVHAGADLDRQTPALEQVIANNGTHDENDEVITDAYRRGLRIRGLRKTRRASLGFIFDEL